MNANGRYLCPGIFPKDFGVYISGVIIRQYCIRPALYVVLYRMHVASLNGILSFTAFIRPLDERAIVVNRACV